MKLGREKKKEERETWIQRTINWGYGGTQLKQWLVLTNDTRVKKSFVWTEILKDLKFWDCEFWWLRV